MSLINFQSLLSYYPSEINATLIRLSIGDEEALKRLTIQPKALSKVDERGWIPLHEAAVQGSREILEVIFSGTGYHGPDVFHSAGFTYRTD